MAEKLKSRKTIQQLFKEGKTYSDLPLRILYLDSKEDLDYLKAAFSVSTKNFKKATDRNRIKRLMRESYRLQKPSLQAMLKKLNKSLSIFIIYTANTLPEYEYIYAKMGEILSRLEKLISQ
jgi:ribonuclease P protein component